MQEYGDRPGTAHTVHLSHHTDTDVQAQIQNQRRIE
jgi:hypothetical protein